MAKHHDLTQPYAIHPFAFTSNGDPANDPDADVSAYKGWINTGASNALKIRNAGNSAWEDVTAGASLSYASNANAVSSVPAGGAATTVSRGDHVHLGVTSLAHTSNTYSGPITIVAAGGLGISSPSAGTYVLSAPTSSGGSGGSGNPTDSYLGYNTIGGTAAAFAQNSYVLKAITPATDVLLLSVEGYIALNAEGANPVVFCGVLTDNAGTAALALRNGEADPILDTINGAGGLSPRWYGPPMAPVVLTAGTQYWLQFGYSAGGNWLNFYRDGSGTDKTVAASGLYGDAGFFTITGTTDRYSIRALVIAL